MKKIIVVTDTMSGIEEAEALKLGVKIIPMPFIINGMDYFEGKNLTREKFFSKLSDDETTVSTSQPSIYSVKEVWDSLLEDYDEVLHIPMTSGLSKSYETQSNEAERNYKGRVFVVDNKRISVTLRQSVIDALELVKLGYDAKEIKEILESVRLESKIYIMLDTLKYLKKGGRITPAAAALGGMLKIKPVLYFHGEKLDKYRMRNRSLENGEEIMIDAVMRDINGFLYEIDNNISNVRIGIAYTEAVEDRVEEFKSKIREKFGNIDIVADKLPLAIACHTGDGAIGICVTKNIPDKYINRAHIEERVSLTETRLYK